MPNSRLTTLGGFAFHVDAISMPSPATRKARAIMTFLVMNRHSETARERLLEIFWPDVDPERARASLNTALHSIRRCLRTVDIEATDFIVANKAIVRWVADTTVDALQFAGLAAGVDPAANRQALQLYRGDFLEGDYDDWAIAERERLGALYETVLARTVRTSKDTEAAQRLIARNPYDEEAYATLVEAELAAGRRASAASWVERCRNALSEVSEKPSPAFETQFGNIIYVDSSALDELTLPFTGRQTELALLAARFADAKAGHGSLTLVHGEAGIGKSWLLHRAERIATQKDLRVVIVRCAGEVPITFGPWPGIFSALAAGDFESLVRAHAGDLATAVAQAVAARLPEPTAIIVDDLHELTAEALDIFVALAKVAISEHAVVAGLRPECASIMRSRLTELPFEELPLGRLARNDLKWALAQTLGSEQSELLDVLYDRTNGHPLFFTGLLNSLVTTGALKRDGYRWRHTEIIDAKLELPDTVKRFIETRIQARGDAARETACALALEPTANSIDLASALHFDELTTLDALDDLLALGVITQPLSGAQFAFTHDLIREVAAAGLNAGRRASLHRAFAQRLKKSGQAEASLRVARHLEAAGEPLSAAESYVKAAQEALEMNAAQDAIDRCEAGIRVAGKLERMPSRDVLLATLHRMAARAAIAAGNVDEAIRRARDAAILARSGEDLHESAKALLDLAFVEGAAFHVVEQKSDAAAALEQARMCDDDVLEAQAQVQQAAAARQLGLREEALQASRSASSLALKCDRPDIAATALEERLRAQLTWWLFSQALETAHAGLDIARRLEPFVEAGLRQARCELWYLLDRFDDGEAELRTALRIANETRMQRRESVAAPVHAQPYLQFACYYMAGKIAVAQGQWDGAIEAADAAAALTNVAKLPRNSEALSLLRIDAMLQRNLPGDSEAAHELTTTLGEPTFAQGTIGWSDCLELARARVAARLREPDASAQLRRAIDALEENAHRALFDSDLAFSRLAEAASEFGEGDVSLQALARSKYYKSWRLAAAGASWGRLTVDRGIDAKSSAGKGLV